MDPITRGVYTYHGPEMKHFDWVLKVNYYVFCKTTKTFIWPLKASETKHCFSDGTKQQNKMFV